MWAVAEYPADQSLWFVSNFDFECGERPAISPGVFLDARDLSSRDSSTAQKH